MADTNINLADFLSEGDDELVFDDMAFDPPAAAPEPVPAPAPEPPAPESVADAAKPRRTPRRGRDADSEAASASPSLPPASVAASPAAEESADPPAPVPQPDAGSAGFDRRSAMLLAVVIFALFTSLLSLGGTLAISRTLAHAQADRARAEEERSELARVPAIVKALNDASIKLAIAASHTPNGPPATPDDVRKSLDDFRVALSAHQPDGMAALNGATHDGFTELGNRMLRIQADIDAISHAVNANRRGPPATDPAQPS